MITAAFKALGDLMSRDFRAILFRAVGMTLGLFIAILIGVEVLLSYLLSLPWPWAETLAGIGTFLVLLVAFFFIMAPVTAMFAGLYLDDCRREGGAQALWPLDPKGTPQPALQSVADLRCSSALVILAGEHRLALPLVFTGFGAIALVIIANAYLLSAGNISRWRPCGT